MYRKWEVPELRNPNTNTKIKGLGLRAQNLNWEGKLVRVK